MKKISKFFAILIISVCTVAQPAFAQDFGRIARAAGVVPAGCWGGTIEQVICAATRRQPSRVGYQTQRHPQADARQAMSRIADWHEMNAVMQRGCVPDQRNSCGLRGTTAKVIPLQAAWQLMGLCQDGNRMACSQLVREAPSERR